MEDGMSSSGRARPRSRTTRDRSLANLRHTPAAFASLLENQRTIFTMDQIQLQHTTLGYKVFWDSDNMYQALLLFSNACIGGRKASKQRQDKQVKKAMQQDKGQESRRS